MRIVPVLNSSIFISQVKLVCEKLSSHFYVLSVHKLQASVILVALCCIAALISLALTFGLEKFNNDSYL